MAEDVTLRFRTKGVGRAVAAFDKLERNAEDLRRVGQKMQDVGQGLTMGLTLPLGAAAAASVKLASDAQETENLFNSAMGSMTEEANAFVEQWSAATDLDPIATKKRLATFQLMISNMGVASNRALQMSEDLTKLTVDLASLRNVSFERAFTKLQSGLSGEMEALRRWGIIVGQAKIEQVALREGIIEAGEEMTQQQKLISRYLAIMNQTNTEQGDFIETQDQLANSLRTLKDQVKVAARSIGEDLIPIVEDAVEVAKGLVKSFADMDAETRKTIITVGALAAAFGPLLTAAGGLTQFLAFAPGAVSTLGTALGALASGPAAAALAVLVGTGSIVWAFNKISDTGNPAANAISEIAASMDVLGQTANERLSDVRGVVRETRKLARLQRGGPVSGQIPGFQPTAATQQGMMDLLFGPGASFAGSGGGGGGVAGAANAATSIWEGAIDAQKVFQNQLERTRRALVDVVRLENVLGTPAGGGVTTAQQVRGFLGRTAPAAARTPRAVRAQGLPAKEMVNAAEFAGASMQELVNVTLQGGEGMKRAAQATVSAFGAMAQAAIRGSDQMATSLIQGITQIVRSIPGVGGLAGSIIGAAGSVLSAAFSGGSDQVRPQPVTVENGDPIDVEDQSDRGPEEVVLQFLNAADPEQLQHDLNRRTKRDGVTRIPFGTDITEG